MAETDTSTPWTRTIARAMKDKAFKSRLMANPTATLKEAGVDVPDDVVVKVVENTATEVHMVLPYYADDQVSDDQVSDDALERIAAGRTPYEPPTRQGGAPYC